MNQPANLQSTVSMYVAIFDAYGIKEDEVTKGGSIFRSNSAGGISCCHRFHFTQGILVPGWHGMLTIPFSAWARANS